MYWGSRHKLKFGYKGQILCELYLIIVSLSLGHRLDLAQLGDWGRGIGHKR